MNSATARSPLVDRLLTPAAYRHEVGPIHLVETHISWVFLTGRYAYKVKKPVNLGFLDFATLERRRHFCHEEIRLNRRFAPSLYLAAVPITGPPQAAVVDGRGEAIDWAVQLTQFDEGERLDHVLDAGRLSSSDCEMLAREIAAVQERLEIAPKASPWGTMDAVRDAVAINLEQLCRHRPEASARVERIRRWIEARIHTAAATFSARRNSGRVRQCHGDLHLANLVRHEGHFVAFDSIEFSDSLRWIDVASDLAFLVMDLESRGRGDLAAVVRSGWIEAADDHAAAGVLPIYLVYRGVVRAAIAAIRGSQPEADSVAARDESDRYLELAERLAAPPRPVMFATCGASGSGKTTLAAELVAATGAVRLRSDVERKRLAGLRATDRPTSAESTADLYSAEATRATYERLAHLARRLLVAGQSVVVDASCTARWQRRGLADAATRAGVPLVWLALELPEEKLLARVQTRRAECHDASDATEEVVRRQLASFDPITDGELTDSARESIVRLSVESLDTGDLVNTITRHVRGLADPRH